MTPRRKVLFVSLLVLGAALLTLALLGLLLLLLPTEVSTELLIIVLLAVVAGVGLLVFFVLNVLKLVDTEWQRLAIAGVGLLSVGSALTFGLLPEHNATGALAGAVGVLPPSPGTHDRGFDVGLAAQPRGCSESVPIKLVVNGSTAYWSEHHSPPGAWLPFVIVLPGHFNDLKTGLGRIDTIPVADPEQANIDNSALKELRKYLVVAPGKRALTVISGEVEGWSQTRRPVIVTADADWITRRGVNDCNLQLPALTGAPSALAVVEALTCQGLDHSYLAGSCMDPPGLEVSEAAAMVSGSDISGSESVPEPVEIDESPGWRCRTPSPTAAPQITGGLEAGSGSASASIVSQGDCHAVATVLASSWHRDFLLVLIGALMAVGVHMIFQAMVESRPKDKSDESGGAGSPDQSTAA
jgi:hypothetical protein